VHGLGEELSQDHARRRADRHAEPDLAGHAAGRPGSLVVIGSHGRTGWRAAVLGSSARRVVTLAESPVLVLRPAAARPS
jgi:nucleotide-binding universal stress UspA family protein